MLFEYSYILLIWAHDKSALPQIACPQAIPNFHSTYNPKINGLFPDHFTLDY